MFREKRKPLRARLGTRAWMLLHRLAIEWPCLRCRPNLRAWMEGFHDAINVRLGKPLFQAVSFGRFATGELEGRYHPACVACSLARTALRAIGDVSWEGDGKPSSVPSPVGSDGAMENGLERGVPPNDHSSPRRRGGGP